MNTPVINIFGMVHQSGGCGAECLGAVELLRSRGIAVRCIVPSEDPYILEGQPEADYLRAIGVEVVHYAPGMFAKCKVLVSFGEEYCFDLMREHCDTPGWFVWSSGMFFAIDYEQKAHKDGLIDEFFFQHIDVATTLSGKELHEKTKKGFFFRPNYQPHFNPQSPFRRLRYGPTKPTDQFNVGRISRDDENKWHPEAWRIFSEIVAPQRVQIDVVGWGEKAAAKVGNPCADDHYWNSRLNLQLHTHCTDPAVTAAFYARTHVLVHFWDQFIETFGYATVEAMASGTVVIAKPEGGFARMINHGKTGYLANTTDEAIYYSSKLAFEPATRKAMAQRAYEWLMREGPGNPDLAWPWWQELILRASL